MKSKQGVFNKGKEKKGVPRTIAKLYQTHKLNKVYDIYLYKLSDNIMTVCHSYLLITWYDS